MRARYKGPSGTGVLELPDDATVQAVFDDLKSKTGLLSFSLKYGPPMAMKSLDTSQGNEGARSLGLHGETLTIVPEAVPPPPALPEISHPTTAHGKPVGRQPRTQPSENPEEILVPWPQREGTLCKSYYPALATTAA